MFIIIILPFFLHECTLICKQKLLSSEYRYGAMQYYTVHTVLTASKYTLASRPVRSDFPVILSILTGRRWDAWMVNEDATKYVGA